MTEENLITWLLEGDPSIQYQTNRDLLNKNKKNVQNKISKEGWGKNFLSLQKEDGHWGKAFYQPKWISTHYTLLDLKNLSISPSTRSIRKIIASVLKKEMNRSYEKKFEMIVNKDMCINGMVLNYSSYFNSVEKDLEPIVDYLIENQMEDGGFNCMSNRSGAVHSSLHTTLSVAEGISEFEKNGYKYRLKELRKMENECREFILQHRLYKSDKTGKVINYQFLKFLYPSRWRYDILRCLDYFQSSNSKYDERMGDAIDYLITKRKKDGSWPLHAKYPGEIHFEMEKAGKPSRWNTLRALRVLKHFNLHEFL